MNRRIIRQSRSDISLIPLKDFAERVPKILATSKRESDRQIAEFQADNAKRRAAKKKP